MILLDGIIYNLQKAGGISVYFDEMLRGCAERPETDARLILSKEIALWDRFRNPRVPVIVREPRRLERFRSVRIPPDPAPAVFFSSYYRRPMGSVPTVVTVHDFIHRRFGKGPRNRIFLYQQTAAIESASWLICVSESTRQDLLHFFPKLDLSRVSVVHNGVSDTFHPLSGVSREDSIAIVGRRSGYKNFGQAARVMSYLPTHRLEIVGGGPLTADERALLDANCPGRYHEHGYLDQAELNLIYNRCRVLLYLSDYEGFGIPPLEAMRAGCVPLVKLNSSLPEVVGIDGQFVGDDPAEVAERVRSLSDERTFSRASERGLRHAARFSWHKSRERTVDLLLRVATDTTIRNVGSVTGATA